MPYAGPIFEAALGVFGLWAAYIYWTTFDGERFWRVLAGVMVVVSLGAFSAAGWMLSWPHR